VAVVASYIDSIMHAYAFGIIQESQWIVRTRHWIELRITKCAPTLAESVADGNKEYVW